MRKKTPKLPSLPSPFWRAVTSWKGIMIASVAAGLLFILCSFMFLTYGYVDFLELGERVDEELSWLKVFGHLAAFRREVAANVLAFIGLHLLWLLFHLTFLVAPVSTVLLIIRDAIKERGLSSTNLKALTFILGMFVIILMAALVLSFATSH